MKIKYVRMELFVCLAMGVVWSEYFMATADGNTLSRVLTAQVIEANVAETTQVVGTLFFDRVSKLSSEVSGQINAVHVRKGDQVNKGQVMFELNTDFVNNEMASVRAGMEQLKVRLDNAQKDLGRYEALFHQGALSETEYDDRVLSKTFLVKQMATLNIKLALARLKKEKSVILAPFDGVVIEKISETGEWVAPASWLCTVGAINDLFVKVPVSESLLVFARQGTKVPVSITALGKSVTGTIAGVIPVADPQTRTVFVKVALPVLENPVQNMSAMVDMPVTDKKNMFLVPRAALVSFNGQEMVYTVSCEGRASPIPVSIRSYVGKYVAVDAQGIHNGLFVVVDGNARLRPGQSVTVDE